MCLCVCDTWYTLVISVPVCVQHLCIIKLASHQQQIALSL